MSDKSKVFEQYNVIADWFDHNRSREINLEKSHLDQLLARLSPDSYILDLGCGTGRPIAQYLLSQGMRVKGVDGSHKMVSLAQKYVPSINAEVQDMRHFTSLEKFDAIIMWHSSFHLPVEDQHFLIKNLSKNLKNPGFLLFTSGPEHGEAWGENGGENLYHASLSPTEYKKILHSAGFKVLSHTVNDPQAGGATVWLCRFEGL